MDGLAGRRPAIRAEVNPTGDVGEDVGAGVTWGGASWGCSRGADGLLKMETSENGEHVNDMKILFFVDAPAAGVAGARTVNAQSRQCGPGAGLPARPPRVDVAPNELRSGKTRSVNRPAGATLAVSPQPGSSCSLCALQRFETEYLCYAGVRRETGKPGKQ